MCTLCACRCPASCLFSTPNSTYTPSLESSPTWVSTACTVCMYNYMYIGKHCICTVCMYNYIGIYIYIHIGTACTVCMYNCIGRHYIHVHVYVLFVCTTALVGAVCTVCTCICTVCTCICTVCTCFNER